MKKHKVSLYALNGNEIVFLLSNNAERENVFNGIANIVGYEPQTPIPTLIEAPNISPKSTPEIESQKSSVLTDTDTTVVAKKKPKNIKPKTIDKKFEIESRPKYKVINRVLDKCVQHKKLVRDLYYLDDKELSIIAFDDETARIISESIDSIKRIWIKIPQLLALKSSLYEPSLLESEFDCLSSLPSLNEALDDMLKIRDQGFNVKENLLQIYVWTQNETVYDDISQYIKDLNYETLDVDIPLSLLPRLKKNESTVAQVMEWVYEYDLIDVTIHPKLWAVTETKEFYKDKVRDLLGPIHPQPYVIRYWIFAKKDKKDNITTFRNYIKDYIMKIYRLNSIILKDMRQLYDLHKRTIINVNDKFNIGSHLSIKYGWLYIFPKHLNNDGSLNKFTNERINDIKLYIESKLIEIRDKYCLIINSNDVKDLRVFLINKNQYRIKTLINKHSGLLWFNDIQKEVHIYCENMDILNEIKTETLPLINDTSNIFKISKDKFNLIFNNKNSKLSQQFYNIIKITNTIYYPDKNESSIIICNQNIKDSQKTLNMLDKILK